MSCNIYTMLLEHWLENVANCAIVKTIGLYQQTLEYLDSQEN